MSISTVARESLPAASGMTWLAFLSHMPPEAVLGAFSGSIVFLLGVSNKKPWEWMLLFSSALIAGLLGASTFAGIVNGAFGLVGIKLAMPIGMGAMASASISVNLLIWVRDNAGRIAAKKLGVTPAPKGDAE
jgi:hypothetical protein